MALQEQNSGRAFSVVDMEREMGATLDRQPNTRNRRPVDYAPPAVRTPIPPMPEYVQHREGVSEVGRLSAEAVVRDYEAAAKHIEAMGKELMETARKAEAMAAGAHAALAEVKETAERYRDEGKRIFLQIEDCALMTQEVRDTCGTLTKKIAGPASS